MRVRQALDVPAEAHAVPRVSERVVIGQIEDGLEGSGQRAAPFEGGRFEGRAECVIGGEGSCGFAGDLGSTCFRISVRAEPAVASRVGKPFGLDHSQTNAAIAGPFALELAPLV
jgi:hypothetical protein